MGQSIPAIWTWSEAFHVGRRQRELMQPGPCTKLKLGNSLEAMDVPQFITTHHLSLRERSKGFAHAEKARSQSNPAIWAWIEAFHVDIKGKEGLAYPTWLMHPTRAGTHLGSNECVSFCPNTPLVMQR